MAISIVYFGSQPNLTRSKLLALDSIISSDLVSIEPKSNSDLDWSILWIVDTNSFIDMDCPVPTSNSTKFFL